MPLRAVQEALTPHSTGSQRDLRLDDVVARPQRIQLRVQEGVDARALEIPRKMFASARKIENGGSLTILATALVDTGSRMDELIFQEFKGTGNMELILDRKLSDRRLFPAIDIPKSGTRKEEKLFPAKNLEAIRKLRRTMVDLNPIEAMETLTAALKKNKTNDELLAKLEKNS